MNKKILLIVFVMLAPFFMTGLCSTKVKAGDTEKNLKGEKPSEQELTFKKDADESSKDEDFLANPLVEIKSLNIKARPVSPQAAITASVKQYKRGGKAEVILAGNNRLLYPYGLMDATMTCAVLRVCSIDLEEGEVIEGKPYVGDSLRWWIGFSRSGSVERSVPHLIVKPLVNDAIETNLIINTDRRVYTIVLRSILEGDYTQTIGFYYPQEAQELPNPLGSDNLKYPENVKGKNGRSVSIDDLDFNYFIHGKKRPWTPERVYNDSAKTFIQIPERAKNYELPLFFIVGDDGKYELANYRLKTSKEGDIYYVVDRLFSRGVLLLSKEGKKEQRVYIVKMRD